MEMEYFRQLLRRVAEFTGAFIITYTILSNHFHVLLLIPQRVLVDDEELLRRYAVLHPIPSKYCESVDVMRAKLAKNGPEGQALRRRLHALMYDLSQFSKLLKQNFSIWFNDTHDRFGPLWSDRFGSVLLEAGEPVRNVAAYIDLNCVRAGIVKDPAYYRFCGYAEALAGSEIARIGLMALGLAPSGTWNETQSSYRVLLYAIGSGARAHGVVIDDEDYRKVIEEGGELTLPIRFACKIRHFTTGAVLGSRLFVEEQLTRYRQRHGPCPRTRPRSVPDLLNLMTLKSPR